MKTFNYHSIVALAARNVNKAAKARKANAYKYRGMPCTDATHSVDGHDLVIRGGGVLEWCFSQQDAELVMARMQKDKGRFKNLHISVNN